MIMSSECSALSRLAFARISMMSMPGVSSTQIFPRAIRAEASARSRQFFSDSMPERIR